MTTAGVSAFPNRKHLWLIVFATLAIAFAVVFIPVWIIQPFKPQTTRGVEVSYMLRRFSPWITLVALMFGFLLLVKLWMASRRWWEKALLVIILIPLLASTWFARQNHFEWMFNPLANAAYAKIHDAGFVGADDVVLAIEINGEAAAYPVRLLAYHHLVEDVVGGTPIVATY
jgi:Protein of unknown function (DUF3179)